MRVAAATATFAAVALMLGAAGPASAQYYQAQVYTAPPTPPAAAYGQAAWGQPYGSGYVYGRGGVAGGEASGRVYASSGRAATGYTAYSYGYDGGPSYDYGYSYGGHGGYDRGGYDHGGYGCGRSSCAPPPRHDDCYSGCGGGYRHDYVPPRYPSCDHGCGGYDRGGRYGYSEGGRYYYGSSSSYSSRSYSTRSYRDEWGYNDDRPATARGYGRDDGYYRRDRDCGCAYPLDDR